MTTPTTPPRVHMPHIHLPPATGVAVVAGLVVLAVCYAAHQQRKRRRAQLEASALGIFHGFLKVPVELNRHTFGRPPVRWEGRRLARISVRFAPGHRHTLLDFAPKLELALAHVFGGPVRVDVNAPKRTITATRRPLPTPLPTKVPLPAASKGAASMLPLAVAAADRRIVWDLNNQQQTNMIIVGSTGSAKSTVEAAIAAAATSRGHKVWIVDGKGDSFDGFPWWPGVERFEADPDNHDGMIAALEDFHALRQARSKQKAAGQTPPGGFDHLILIADEVGLLIQDGDRRQTERAQTALRNLVRGVRSVNMHVVVGVHQPSGELLGGTETRRLFGVHVGLALRDRDQQLRTMIGVPDDARSGTGRGRALIHMDGHPGLDWTEAQTFYVACGLPDDVSPEDRNHQAVLRREAERHFPALIPGDTTRDNPLGQPADTPRDTARDRLPDPLPADTVRRIHELRGDNKSIRAIAAEVGVSPSAVHRYVNRPPALHLVKDGDT